MSWFPDSDSRLSDDLPGTAVGEGVTLERRTVLRPSGAALLAALALPACSSPARRLGTAGAAAAGPPSEELLSLGEVMAQADPLARRLVDEGMAREEVYLREVTALLTRMRPPTREELQAAWRESRARRDAESGFPGYTMAVMRFRLEPGKGFSYHDHRDYNGVIVGVDGEARIRNFEILGDSLVPPEGTTFRIRQTRDDLLLPGRYSTLGTRRDNVHDVVAGPDGATVLDAFTFFAKDARSYGMEVDEEPRDAERRIFDAAWA